MKILVDTNVIIDFFLTRKPHYDAAVSLFELIYKGEVKAFTTASCITDIYYIVAKRLGRDTAKDALRSLFALVSIITVDVNDCTWALDLPIADYEDALVITCSSKEHIDYVITNDLEFAKIISMQPRVMTTATFLQYVRH